MLSRREMRLRSTIAAAVAILLAGCTSSARPAFDARALASGATVVSLAAGKLDSWPTGAVFVRVIEFKQPALHTFGSAQHTPGFVYVAEGVSRLKLEESQPVDIAAGTARFHVNVTHTHSNPGSEPNDWYFIAVWPSSLRGTAPVSPLANFVFQSSDFSPDELPQGAYSEVLRRVKLASSGRSEAHQFGGLSLFFVLEGSLAIHTEQGVVTLQHDQGAAYGPDVALQELNASGGSSVYLEMITTAAGHEFEVPLVRSP